MIENAPSDKTCFIFEDKTITYGEFCQQITKIATGLQERGVVRGDTVAVWLPNTPEWIAITFACARLGASVLSLNLRFGVHEVSDFLKRSRSKVLFYVPEYKGRNYQDTIMSLESDALENLSLLISSSATSQFLGNITQIDFEDLVQSESVFSADPSVSNTDACIILSSSGTTSKAKLIKHSQLCIVRHSEDICRYFNIDLTSSLLQAVPFCGAFGFTIGLAALSANCPLVILENFDPREVVRCLNQYEITHMFGTNDMLDKMLDTVANDWRPTALQMYGHANFTPGLTELPARALSYGVAMRGCFGMSETLALFASQKADADLERASQSGGFPVSPNSRVRIRCVDTGAYLAPNNIGELELYTDDIMLGYLGDEEATTKAFTDDGFLKTGDLAYLNEDGGFTHLSRIGDVLRIGGFLVNPLEIEETILHDSELEPQYKPLACQVVEVEAEGSSRPFAFVIGHKQYVHDEAKIKELCKRKLAIYKVPIRVVMLDKFPVTQSPNGEKVKKNELRITAHELLRN